MKITDKDILFMRRALTLAAKAKGMTSPNPMVGAVIVRNGKIISEDYHKRAGEPHAEALAIASAGDKVKGAVLYVTLEPCCHKDKRTPPCTGVIINSGIKKVFMAMKDPNPKVSGNGMNELKKHGIEVICGVLEDKAKSLNEAYIKYITTGIPFVVLKAAMTLDGKIATPDGRSRWITGEKARRIVHQMRSRADAILTAVGTVKADNPEFTARINGGRNPRRIIIDPDLETPLNYKIFNIPPETIVVTKNVKAIKSNEEELIGKGVRILQYEGEKVNLKWLMRKLGGMGIVSVMVEGGSSLNASALLSGIVDKVVFFIAPKIIGGRDSITVVGGNAFLKLDDALRLERISIKMAGDDMMIEGYLSR